MSFDLNVPYADKRIYGIVSSMSKFKHVTKMQIIPLLMPLSLSFFFFFLFLTIQRFYIQKMLNVSKNVYCICTVLHFLKCFAISFEHVVVGVRCSRALPYIAPPNLPRLFSFISLASRYMKLLLNISNSQSSILKFLSIKFLF